MGFAVVVVVFVVVVVVVVVRVVRVVRCARAPEKPARVNAAARAAIIVRFIEVSRISFFDERPLKAGDLRTGESRETCRFILESLPIAAAVPR
jgi:hypothetical protein